LIRINHAQKLRGEERKKKNEGREEELVAKATL
jgi:hypothetical protein